MIKYLQFFVVGVIFFAFSQGYSQYNVSEIYNPFSGLSASDNLPTKLGSDGKKLHFRVLPNINFDINSLKNLQSFTTSVTNLANNTFSEIKKFDLAMRLNMQLPSVAFSLKNSDKKRYFTFGLINRFQTNFDIEGGEALDYFNKYDERASLYNNKTIEGSLKLNFVAYTKTKASALIKLYPSSGTNITLAVGVNYYSSSLYLSIPNAQVTIETDSKGDVQKYDSKGSLEITSNSPNSSTVGSGFGLDLGVSINLKDRLTLSAGLTDFGANIKFSEVKIYTSQSSANIQRLSVVTGGGLYEIMSGLTNNIGFNKPLTTVDSRIVALPSKLTVSGEYGFIKKNKDKKNTFFKHTFRGIMIQRVIQSEKLELLPLSFVSVGYNYQPFRVMNIGLHTSTNFTDYQLGANVWFDLGPFNFGVYSQSALSALMSGEHIDVGFSTKWAFL